MITKKIVVAKREILENGLIFTVENTILEEDGLELARLPPNRRSLEPDFEKPLTDDVTSKIIDLVWTKEVIEEYKKKKQEAIDKLTPKADHESGTSITPGT